MEHIEQGCKLSLQGATWRPLGHLRERSAHTRAITAIRGAAFPQPRRCHGPRAGQQPAGVAPGVAADRADRQGGHPPRVRCVCLDASLHVPIDLAAWKDSEQQQWQSALTPACDAGVRGVARGQLLAFDSFLNLLLRDVEESYTVLVRVCRPAGATGAGQQGGAAQGGGGGAAAPHQAEPGSKRGEAGDASRRQDPPEPGAVPAAGTSGRAEAAAQPGGKVRRRTTPRQG